MTIQTMASAVRSGNMYRTYAQQINENNIKPYVGSVAHDTQAQAIANQVIYTYADGIRAGKILKYADALA